MNFTDFISTIFGTYQPIDVIDTSGEVIASMTDLGYVASVFVLCLFIYFCLKTVGGIIYEWVR